MNPDQHAAHVAVLETLGDQRASYLRRANEATERLRNAAEGAYAAGMSQAEIARWTGVTRMTVRAWLGKGKP